MSDHAVWMIVFVLLGLANLVALVGALVALSKERIDAGALSFLLLLVGVSGALMWVVPLRGVR